MKKFVKVILSICLITLLCTCLYACGNTKYYQYTGATMDVFEGTSTTLKQKIQVGETFILTSPTVTIRTEKDGSTTKFVGWRLKGTDEVYSVGQKLTMGKKNMTFVAVWKQANTITFANASTTETGTLPTMEETYYAVDEQVVLPQCSLTNQGFGFAGWKDNDGNLYKAGDTFIMPNHAVTFLPKWTDVYTLDFTYGNANAQQVTGNAPAIAPRELGATLLIPQCTYSYAGHDFLYWESDGEQYYVGDTYTVTGNAVFNAVWQESAVTSTDTFDFTLLSDQTYAIAKSSTLTKPLSGNLVLPETFEDKPVTKIAKDGFKGTAIESVTIPNTITTIEQNAFANATKLFYVLISEDSQLKTIESNAFLNCSQLATFGVQDTSKNSLVLPNSIQQIGDKAFYGCAFTTVTINQNLTTLGNGVFSNQQKLTQFVSNNDAFVGGESLTDKNQTVIYAYAYASQNAKTITLNVQTILPYAFAFAPITSLTLGANVTTIDKHAFEHCTNLKTITYDPQNALTTINDNAFLSCSSLTEVTLIKSLTNFSLSAFEGCINVTKFIVDEQNPNFASYGDNLYDKNKTTFLLYAPSNTEPDCFIPSTVTKISANAFAYSKVEEVFVYNTDDAYEIIVEEKAFYHCSFLKTLSFWDSIISIGNRAFEYCSVLSSAKLGDKLQSLGDYAFYYCEKLSSATISQNCSVIELSPYTFANCGLTEFNTNGVIQVLNTSALASCVNMTKVYLDGVLEIEKNVFDSCTQLKAVEIPSTLITLAGSAFINCHTNLAFTVNQDNAYFSADANGNLYNNDKTTLVICSPKNATTTFVLPSTVKEIAPYAFYGCALTVFDATNSQLQTIGSYAFGDCSSLTTVKVPQALKTIKSYAFFKCSLMTSFDFLDNLGNKVNQQLTKIEEYAFYNCIRLKLYLRGENLPLIDQNAFYLSPDAAAASNKPKIFVESNLLQDAKTRWPFATDYLTALTNED